MSRGANGDPSKTRAVGYAFEGLDANGVSTAERLLCDAHARAEIAQHDGGGDLVWFNGPPGETLRALRDKIADLPGARPVRR